MGNSDLDHVLFSMIVHYLVCTIIRCYEIRASDKRLNCENLSAICAHDIHQTEMKESRPTFPLSLGLLFYFYSFIFYVYAVKAVKWK